MREESRWIRCLWTRLWGSLDEGGAGAGDEGAYSSDRRQSSGWRDLASLELKDKIERKLVVTKNRGRDGVSSSVRVE